jgi:hypothetical protein
MRPAPYRRNTEREFHEVPSHETIVSIHFDDCTPLAVIGHKCIEPRLRRHGHSGGATC